MNIFMARIDAVPTSDNDFKVPFLQWLWVLVDTLNEDIDTLQNALNFLTAPNYTAAEIASMEIAGDLGNGIFLYDTTNNVYVGKESGSLVKFTTTAYP